MGDRPKGLFFEELEVGAQFKTKSRTVTEADIVNFAGVSGDFNELHLSAAFAEQTQFGKRIAHGLLGLAISSGLTQQLDLYNDTLVAFLGLTWKFTGPIYIGDTVHVVQTIKEKRPTKKPGRGVVTFAVQVVNQRGEAVQEGERTLMIRMKQE